MDFDLSPFILASLVMISSATVVSGQSACFCLQNHDTLEIVRWGCKAIRKPNGVTDIVRCQTGDFLDRELISNAHEFNRIVDGNGLCVPCTGTPSEGGQDAIRNPETAQTQNNDTATHDPRGNNDTEATQ